jgi:hypothetical protein
MELMGYMLQDNGCRNQQLNKIGKKIKNKEA